MKKLFGWISMALVIAAAAAVTRADIPPPRDLTPYKLNPPANQDWKPGETRTAGSGHFAVIASGDTDVVRLQIPRQVLQDLQAAAGNTATTSGMTGEQTRTLFAGVFFSFALAFGGVWILKVRKHPAARVVAMLMIAAAVAGTATTVSWANAGPPGRVIYPPGTLPRALKNDPSLDGTVVYEVKDQGNINLIIPTRELHRNAK
jgi:hypothetical protein